MLQPSSAHTMIHSTVIIPVNDGVLKMLDASQRLFFPSKPWTQQPAAASYNVTSHFSSFLLSEHQQFWQQCSPLSGNNAQYSATRWLLCMDQVNLASVVEIEVFGLLVTWNIFICLCRTFAFCSSVSQSRGRDGSALLCEETAPFLNANNVSSSRFINKTWGGSFRHSRVTANTHLHDCRL